MRFLLDENIPGHTEAFLRAHRHEVFRAPTGLSDASVLGLATRRRAILLTRDQDFLSLLPPKPVGLIVIRIHPTIAETVTRAVRELLATHPPRWLRGKVLILHPKGYEIVR